MSQSALDLAAFIFFSFLKATFVLFQETQAVILKYYLFHISNFQHHVNDKYNSFETENQALMLSNIKKKCLAWSNASSVQSWQTKSADPNRWNSCRCGQSGVPVNTRWSQLQISHREHSNTWSATRSLTHQRQIVIYTYLYTQLHSSYKFIIHLKQKNLFFSSIGNNTTTFTATPKLQHYKFILFLEYFVHLFTSLNTFYLVWLIIYIAHMHAYTFLRNYRSHLICCAFGMLTTIKNYQSSSFTTFGVHMDRFYWMF